MVSDHGDGDVAIVYRRCISVTGKAELIGDFCVNRRCAPNRSVSPHLSRFHLFAVTGTIGEKPEW